jgi:hypothetical protein
VDHAGYDDAGCLHQLGLSQGTPTSIPLGGISQVEVRRPNALTTLGLVAGVGTVAFVIAVLATIPAT